MCFFLLSFGAGCNRLNRFRLLASIVTSVVGSVVIIIFFIQINFLFSCAYWLCSFFLSCLSLLLVRYLLSLFLRKFSLSLSSYFSLFALSCINVRLSSFFLSSFLSLLSFPPLLFFSPFLALSLSPFLALSLSLANSAPARSSACRPASPGTSVASVAPDAGQAGWWRSPG